MRYVKARLKEEEQTWAYRFYVANSLQNIPQGSHIIPTLYDIMHNPPQPVDKRTGAEIMADIVSRAGLVFGD